VAGELSFSSEFHLFAVVIRQAFGWPVGLTGFHRQGEVNYLLLFGFFLGFLFSFLLGFFLGGFLLCYFLFSFLFSFLFCHV
jgi:hypothetical protein